MGAYQRRAVSGARLRGTRQTGDHIPGAVPSVCIHFSGKNALYSLDWRIEDVTLEHGLIRQLEHLMEPPLSRPPFVTDRMDVNVVGVIQGEITVSSAALPTRSHRRRKPQPD